MSIGPRPPQPQPQPQPQPLELEVGPLRLSQALSNPLTNAAKYTDPGGEILLIVSLDEQELRMTVKDTGIGLSPRAMSQVFEMFSQLESAIDRAEAGLGIGLALVKGLVALHGGAVEAASAGLGHGSEFTIRLPGEVVRARLPGIVRGTTAGQRRSQALQGIGSG